MDIQNTYNISSYHPVGVQAGIKTEPELQGRGPDSVPPAQNSSSTVDMNPNSDSSQSAGRRLDITA